MRKCPKCGSENIESEVCGGHRTGDKICKDCGYVGWVKDFEVQKPQEHKLDISNFTESKERTNND